jgi:hemolysin III
LEDALEREPVNGWLHFAGALLALAGLVVLEAHAAERGSARHHAAALVYGASVLSMFAASANYHLRPRARRRLLFRRLDHAMIYVCIAGTYTPVCLLGLQGSALGLPMLVSVWAVAVAGVLQKLRFSHAPRALSTGLYLGLGWAGTLIMPALDRTAPEGFLPWLLAGGLLYTLGAVVYWRRWPRWGRPGVFGFHELWHLFVIAASAAHYYGVLAYLMQRA